MDDVEESTKRGRGPFGRSLAFDLTALGLVMTLLAGAFVVGGIWTYRTLYSPSAFITNYLHLLSAGRAADALAVPGVAVDAAALDDAGIPSTASEALLRSTALSSLTDITVVSEKDVDGVTEVTASYIAGGYPGTSTFSVTRDGWNGLAPGWRFSVTPLSAIDITVLGSTRFSVNGFEMDKRQVSPDGVDTDPLDAVSMLTFTPGAYSATIDTKMAKTPGTAVLADMPLRRVPVVLEAQPTAEFTAVVQESVDRFLTQCATQKVLKPTGCPFGYTVQNRLDGEPSWSIVRMPAVAVELDGNDWAFPASEGVAHVSAEIRSLYDGSLRDLDEDVPFIITGSITILPDGRASIKVGGIDPL